MVTSLVPRPGPAYSRRWKICEASTVMRYGLLVGLLVYVPSAAFAEVSGVTITSRSVLAEGRAFGAALSADSARQIDRATDGPQALTLLLMAPEFQRR